MSERSVQTRLTRVKELEEALEEALLQNDLLRNRVVELQAMMAELQTQIEERKSRKRSKKSKTTREQSRKRN